MTPRVIRILMCPESDLAVQVETDDALRRRTAVTLTDGVLGLPLRPTTPCPASRTITLRLMPAAQDIVCAGEDARGARLILRRAGADPGEDGVHDELLRGSMEAVVSHPDHCLWRRTYIADAGSAIEPEHAVGLSVDAVVDPDTLDEVRRAHPDSILEMRNIVAAPGSLLMSVWRYEVIRGALVNRRAALTWFRTTCLTGGFVTAVHGEYGEADLAFTVRCQGRDIECRPTDHTPYAVNDWVTVLDPSDDCRACRHAGRRHPTAVEAGDDAGPASGVIVPIRVLRATQAGAYGEYALEYDVEDLPQLLDLCLETGEVLYVDTEQDRATIHLDGDDDITMPVHYRCAGLTKVSGGSTAFGVGDQALILRDPVRGRVCVGFSDTRRTCPQERSVVLCFLVETPTGSLHGSNMNPPFEEYAWGSGDDWSTQISRGEQPSGHSGFDVYTSFSDYIVPAFSAVFKRVYIRVWGDGSVERLSEAAAADLGYRLTDCWDATLWRKVIAKELAPASGANHATYGEHLAVGQDMVAPTCQHVVALANGSRLAVAKSFAGFCAVLEGEHSTKTAYAVHDPHDFHEWVELVSEGYTEGRESCRYELPAWFTAMYNDARPLKHLEANCVCGSGAEHVCKAHKDCHAVDMVTHCGPYVPCNVHTYDEDSDSFVYGPVQQGDPLSSVLIEIPSTGVRRYHMVGGRHDCARIEGLPQNNALWCADVNVGVLSANCVSVGWTSISHPPSYAAHRTLEETAQRDVVAHGETLHPAGDPLHITGAAPGPFDLTVNQAVDAHGRLAATVGASVVGWANSSSEMNFSDNAMSTEAMGCTVTVNDGDLALSLANVGDMKPDEQPPDFTQNDRELGVRLVDGVNHLALDLVYTKHEGAIVATLTRGRVYPKGSDPETLGIGWNLGVGTIMQAVRDQAFSWAAAPLRPWLCVKKSETSGS